MKPLLHTYKNHYYIVMYIPNGTVDGHLYKPSFRPTLVSKKSPKLSQYVTGSLHKQVTCVQQPGSSVPRVTVISTV